MIKTPAEYQRDYRERKRRAQEGAPDLTEDYLSVPFDVAFADYEHVWSVAEEVLDAVGIEPPTFGSDDPQWREEWDEPYRGSLGRAERMVGSLLDAASTLADIINRYKKREIERAITDLENADLTDHFVKQKALADIVRLSKIRDRLNKTIRWSLSEYQIKGEL